jgi:hypothetical protein
MAAHSPVWISVLLSVLVSSLVVAPAGAEPSPPSIAAPVEHPSVRLQRGYLRLEGQPPSRQALVDALVLRVPHLAFEPFEAAVGPSLRDGVAFVDVRAVPGAALEPARAFDLTIVVSDGRAFDRRVQAGADEEETVRLLASTIANLLLAIEAGSVQADRGDVPLPTTEPACTCACPPALECPVPERPAPVREPGAASTPAPRIELGPMVWLGTVLGLGQPVRADRFAAVGGGVGVLARLRRGALVGAALRTSGRGEPEGTRLVRQRFALGAGYALRRDGWALEASLWGTVEPWWLVGAPIDPPPTPQWGLVARVVPSLERSGLAGGRLRLSVGPVLELGASAALTREGPRVGLVVVRDGRDERSRLRVGGLEASLGLGATLWVGPRPRAR